MLTGLGRSLTAALEECVEPEFTGNAEAIVITSLDVGGQLRPVDIVPLTGMTSGGVTKLLDRLEKAEVIRREYGTISGDRRVSLVTLTPKGQQLAYEYARVVLSRVDDVREAGAQLRDLAG